MRLSGPQAFNAAFDDCFENITSHWFQKRDSRVLAANVESTR